MMRSIHLPVIMGAVVFSAAAAVADVEDGTLDTAMPGLPDDSVVTLSGNVYELNSGDQFTLRTDDGVILVNTPPDMTAPLRVNESVTVTGIVEKPLLGLLGNDLEASRIRVNPSL